MCVGSSGINQWKTLKVTLKMKSILATGFLKSKWTFLDEYDNPRFHGYLGCKESC